MLQVQLQRRAGKIMCSRTEWWWFEEWWFDYTTSLHSKENTQYFDWRNITRTMQFYNCQLKTNSYGKKYLWLQNIQSHGFCQVFAGVCLGSWMFLFLDTRQEPFVHATTAHLLLPWIWRNTLTHCQTVRQFHYGCCAARIFQMLCLFPWPTYGLLHLHLQVSTISNASQHSQNHGVTKQVLRVFSVNYGAFSRWRSGARIHWRLLDIRQPAGTTGRGCQWSWTTKSSASASPWSECNHQENGALVVLSSLASDTDKNLFSRLALTSVLMTRPSSKTWIYFWWLDPIRRTYRHVPLVCVRQIP